MSKLGCSISIHPGYGTSIHLRTMHKCPNLDVTQISTPYNLQISILGIAQMSKPRCHININPGCFTNIHLGHCRNVQTQMLNKQSPQILHKYLPKNCSNVQNLDITQTCIPILYKYRCSTNIQIQMLHKHQTFSIAQILIPGIVKTLDSKCYITIQFEYHHLSIS